MKEIRIFDFDGTVFSKNALSLLVQVKYHSTNIVAFGLWYIFTLFRLPIFLYLYKKDANLFNQYLYKQYKGLSLEYLKKFGDGIGFDFIRDNIYIEGLEEITTAKMSVVISAGLDLFLVPFFTRLGLNPEHIFANSLEFKDGICTGKINDTIIDNEEKANCVKKIKQLYPDTRLLVYGNSKWDYPMLALANEAFCINPSKKLMRFFSDKKLDINALYWNNLFFRLNFLHGLFATKIVAKFFCNKIEGQIINETGSIIISNHQSYLDHYLHGSIVNNGNCCFIAKSEHFQGKLSKFYHSLVRSIPIDRNSPAKSRRSLLIAKYALQLKLNVIIYPEGTRSSSREMSNFKSGFLKLASLVSEVKIIPVTINNAYKILSKGEKIPHFNHRAQIKIHEPIIIKSGFDEQLVLNQCFNTVKGGLAY